MEKIKMTCVICGKEFEEHEETTVISEKAGNKGRVYTLDKACFKGNIHNKWDRCIINQEV